MNPALPLHPASLTGEQAEAMAQTQLKKHHVAIVLLHWFNAFVWLFELATGAALISSPYFRVAPEWYLDMLSSMFGSRANLLRFHISLGVTWTLVFLVYGLFGFRTYLEMEVLQREVGLDRDDWRWLRVRVLRMLHRTTEELPPQGIYNAGQKLFAAEIYLMIPVVMITGLIMAFHLFGAAAVQWAVVLHFVAVGMVVSGLIIHVYMGAVFPEERPAFFSMITGNVNELFAYRHHYKWWREVKMQELEWEREWDAPSGIAPHSSLASAAAPPVAAAPSRPGWAGWFRTALRQPSYWPPYVAGTGLGLTLLATFIVMGQGLGASGGFTRYLVSVIAAIAPGYAAGNPYWGNYYQPGQSPLLDFLVFELIGAAVGGFVSGWLSGRLHRTVDKGPRISRRTRYAFALGGGVLTGLGARLARGCTSGLALSGGAVLSAGAFVFMMAVFAAGFAGAWFMRRYWL